MSIKQGSTVDMCGKLAYMYMYIMYVQEGRDTILVGVARVEQEWDSVA